MEYEHIHREDRLKTRKITIRKATLCKDIDAFSYKLADTVAEGAVRDAIASDSAEGLDSYVIMSLLDGRAAVLYKRLNFCLADEEIEEVSDIDNALSSDYVFTFSLPGRFRDTNLVTASKLMRDYLVKSVLMDWLNKIGTNYGASLLGEVVDTESKIVDIFRLPGFVHHAHVPYVASHKIR